MSDAVAGIGIVFLPKSMVQSYISSGKLKIIVLTEQPKPQDLFMAWKTSNKGKGLSKLTALLSELIQ